ncbi:MAG: invasion associated locus B family protein [Pseudomonadota bacterium]
MKFGKILGATLLLAVMGTSSTAQVSSNQVATKTAWSVFVENNPTECWAVAAPSKTVNTRGGRVVTVSRSDILLFTIYRPSANVKGQVAFTGGYSFRNNSEVSLKVGTQTFSLMTDGEWSWPKTAEDDAKIVNAMKRGNNATLVGVSQRSGTTTTDTFSLQGYTAAVNDAAKRCSS